MGKYSTEQAAGAQRIETPGGDYALKWDDETQMGVNAHAALLSQFAKAGGFLDRLVETCPMRLTSNNAPEVRDLIATVMVSMINGATRFRHFDRLRGDCENVFDEMKNQWGWGGFTARTLAQTALFAGLSVIAANLWNVFTRLCDDGTHREAATSRPLLQSCVARISRHARQGVITIYTAANEKAQGIYRAISAFLAKVASASQLGVEQRRQLIVTYALRRYGLVRRLFPPLIERQATLPLC